MNWIVLKEEDQLNLIKEESKGQPVVIFKHSTRCGISDMAKNRLEKGIKPGDIKFYYLDLIRYREISNRISSIFEVRHQSPQVLIIKDGACIYDESHNGISMSDIIENAA